MVLTVKRKAHRHQSTVLLLALSLQTLALNAQAHHPCAGIDCQELQECKDSAEWVIEATVADVIDMGGNRQCETLGNGVLCGYVENPEIIVLTDATVIKGSFQIGQRRGAVVSRKDTCLSGVLAPMNEKPEVQSLGKRVRFYGNNRTDGSYVRPGYYFVELLGLAREP